MIRLFLGIVLDQIVREECERLQYRLRAAAFDARYEFPEKFHVTLAFLGNMQPELAAPIQAAADDVASRMQRFALTIDRIGAFPNERRPRIVYAGSREQGLAFHKLAAALRDEYRKLGFIFNDDAVAHVTLARVKGGSARPLPAIDVSPVRVAVNEIALFESMPEKETTRYVVRHTAPLQKSAIAS